ncbi:Putative tagatose-6-phosphate ketose/aldose isomerase [Salmonella enterica subsp. arizonae]|uniref:Tagatose-6-phosphate ketose/aldose isomerase n=1 Tax=Salmonella enterica subsp. arizonae TaxID=59203 RepID=A0A379SSY4_SALER|nr:Putative tagatose-6-phosphate ketose/aldose isomerase [Salmonella enterica subsp. arizonae]
MSETYTSAAATTETWTEKEIRQQPASWLRSLNHIDNIRSAIDSFLTPLLHKNNLRIILTGAGYFSIYWRHYRSLACQPDRKKYLCHTDYRSGHQSDGLSEPVASITVDLLRSFR